MRRMILPLVLLAAAGCQPGAAPLSDEDVAAIQGLTTSLAEAELAKDLDAMIAGYAEDAVQMPPNEPAVVGRAAIRTRFAAALEAGMDTREFTITSLAVDGAGELAFDRGTWSWTGVPPGATEPVTENGKYLLVLRRQEDGSWRYVVDIWNSDTPPPPPE